MAPDTRLAFGAAVRSRRAELGITLEQLAQTSGVSTGALSRIERGTLNTSLQNAVGIAAGLGVELGELISSGADLEVVRRGEAQEYIDSETEVRRRLIGRPAPGVELVHYTLPRSTSTPEFAPHRTRTVETFHVLAGTVRIYGDGVELATLSAGDTAQAPGDRSHRIENPGRSEARLVLLITSPR